MEFLTHTTPEAEKMCLACILDDTAAYLRDTLLEPHHFAIQAHADMFAIMLSLHQLGKRVDMLSVADKFGDVDTVAAVMDAGMHSSPQMFRHYEGLVLESWKRREGIRILSDGRAGIDETMDLTGVPNVIARLQALDSIGAQSGETFDELVDETMDELASLDGSMKGISTGNGDVNAMTDGHQDGDLIIIAARPSVGKTAFALFQAQIAAQKDVAVNLFELEMNGKQLVKRMLMSMASVTGAAMRAPTERLSTDEWNRLTTRASTLRNLPIDICDKPYLTVGDIRSRVRQMATRFPGKRQLVVIDYLQLMPVHERPGGPNATQLYGEIARNLKLMAREFNLPVILLSQLNRDSEKRQNKRPMLSDIRQSGEIEQHADVVYLLHRDDYFDPETENKHVIEINIAKQRNGPTGIVKAIYLRDKQLFAEMPKYERKEAQ